MFSACVHAHVFEYLPLQCGVQFAACQTWKRTHQQSLPPLGRMLGWTGFDVNRLGRKKTCVLNFTGNWQFLNINSLSSVKLYALNH